VSHDARHPALALAKLVSEAVRRIAGRHCRTRIGFQKYFEANVRGRCLSTILAMFLTASTAAKDGLSPTCVLDVSSLVQGGTQRWPVEVDRTDFASSASCRRSRSAVARYAGCTQWHFMGVGHGSAVARTAGKLERVLQMLAEEFQARGGLDLEEAFIDPTFAGAKKESRSRAYQTRQGDEIARSRR
jgi:hypothetical protein